MRVPVMANFRMHLCYSGPPASPRFYRSQPCPARRSRVSLLAEHKINGVNVAINGTVKVGPSATNFDVGLIQTPRFGHRACSGLGIRRDEWSKPHHPAVQRRMIHTNTACKMTAFG
jgi:hypothetical protein